VVYRDKFVRGPFHLGAFSYPVALTAVVWIGFISIAFILPQVNVRLSSLSSSSSLSLRHPCLLLRSLHIQPVGSQTFNYSIVRD
jgi:hypothetical protein